MKSFLLLSLLTLSAAEHSHLHHDAVHPHAYGNPPGQVVFSQAAPKRVAIVGAGASGSAAAFFLSRAARVAERRAGLDAGELLDEVVVYEREDWVGGRSTIVYPHDDLTARPIELGASIFVEANRNLVRAAELFNLSVVNPDFAESGVGIWDGTELLFTTSVSKKPWSGWWDTLAALRRYGPLGSYRQGKAVGELLSRFAKLYSPSWLAERGPVKSVEDFVEAADLGNSITTFKGKRWAVEDVKVGERWWSEVMEGSTRVNYASDMDQIHALGAAVSLAAAGARQVDGGNYRIFERMLKDSKAKVHLNTEVTDITPHEGKFRVSAGNSTETFDEVFFAAPWHLSPISKKLEKHFEEPIPKQEYVKLHVTLLTTKEERPNPSYFNQTVFFSMPTTILTTSFTAKQRGSYAPEFQSLTYHRETSPGSGEWIVKIFSFAPIDNYTLNVIFGSRPTWIHRKVWHSYPALRPISSYAPVEPIKGLHYLASLEPWVSTMETQTLSAREAVARLASRWWGIGLGECNDGDSWDLTCEKEEE